MGLCFFCILPFGQLVPLIVWLQSFELPCVDWAFDKLGLEKAERYTPDASTDPLRAYILKKFRTHGGFIIEAMVKNIKLHPQTINVSALSG